MSTVKDPVCGMNVDPEHARGGSFEHAGNRYFFCNPKCRERFAGDPLHYLQRLEAPVAAPAPVPAQAPEKTPKKTPATTAAAAQSGQIWLCPMDPEVRQAYPGACPKC